MIDPCEGCTMNECFGCPIVEIPECYCAVHGVFEGTTCQGCMKDMKGLDDLLDSQLEDIMLEGRD
jgi:hypothetical protein